MTDPTTVPESNGQGTNNAETNTSTMASDTMSPGDNQVFKQLTRSMYIRYIDPTAGTPTPISIASMKIICSDKTVGYLAVQHEHKTLNACLFPTLKMNKDEPEKFTYFLLETLVPMLDYGATSFSFTLAFNRQSKKREILLHLQFQNADHDKFYTSETISASKFVDELKNTPPNNPEECKQIAIAHSIRPEVFQQYLNNFWADKTVPAPFIITWDMWLTISTPANGDLAVVGMTWQDDDFESNHLLLNIETFARKKTDVEVKTNYSARLFFGIHYLITGKQNNHPGVSEFRFYKGKKDDGLKTILIETVYFNGSHQLFDLSNEQP